MRLTELDFDFPEELIAQEPAEPRDSCRLMYLPARGDTRHLRFFDLPDLLRSGDTVVFNDSRVLPARLEAVKPTGGKVELLFLHPAGVDRGADEAAAGRGMTVASGEASSTGGDAAPPGAAGTATQTGLEMWEVLARPSHRLREGGKLLLPGGGESILQRRLGDGRWLLSAAQGVSLSGVMERHGRMPLPPYIRSYSGDPEAYQTVYAAHPGSAAAPTAGLHFSPRVIQSLSEAGVDSAYVTLHVGLDTFQPIREEEVEKHRIHREAYSLTTESVTSLQQTRSRGGRLIAVGTTAARVLETLAVRGLLGADIAAGRSNQRSVVSGTTDIFMTPGYRFRGVDVLLTNFHLPRTTVLALVMAFAGVERIRRAYREAIGAHYRFFSFGDAMLIEPNTEESSAGRISVPQSKRVRVPKEDE